MVYLLNMVDLSMAMLVKWMVTPAPRALLRGRPAGRRRRILATEDLNGDLPTGGVQRMNG
jgi:hypothetical protein